MNNDITRHKQETELKLSIFQRLFIYAGRGLIVMDKTGRVISTEGIDKTFRVISAEGTDKTGRVISAEGIRFGCNILGGVCFITLCVHGSILFST